MRIEYHYQRMYRSSIYPAGRERIHAVGALDCALWDIQGKLLELPVYQLLGGRARDHVECYRSFGAMRLEDARETASKTMAEGYRAIRFHAVGGSGTVFDARRAIGDMMEICAALRDGVGPKGEFIIDAHTRFSLADAVELCERVAPLHPLFVEDPLHIMDDIDAFALLRQKVRVPLAAGEQFGELRDGNLPLVEKELIDFLRSTIPNVGGITGYRKLAVLCEAHGVTMVPHFTPPIATAAVVHALLPFPGQAMNEVLRPALPPYLREAYVHKEGKMFRSDRPGLGVVVDEAAQRRGDDQRRAAGGAVSGRADSAARRVALYLCDDGRYRSSFSTASLNCCESGATPLSKYCATLPSAVTRYLLKFHIGSRVWRASSLNTALASGPFTCWGASIVNFTP